MDTAPLNTGPYLPKEVSSSPYLPTPVFTAPGASMKQRMPSFWTQRTKTHTRGNEGCRQAEPQSSKFWIESVRVAKVHDRPTHFTEAATKATNTDSNLDLQIALKVVHLLSQTLELVQQLSERVLTPEHFVQPFSSRFSRMLR